MKLILQCALIGCMLSTPLYAGMMQGRAPEKSSQQWFGQVNVGSMWSSVGDAQTFYLNPSIEKSYVASGNTAAMPNFELYLGAQKKLPIHILGQLGLVLATTGRAKVEGVIWDDANQLFNNYAYSYKVRNTRLGLKGKALLDKVQRVLPYVSGSANVGFNRANAFNNTPLIFEALPNPNFTNHTETAFSYTLGAGVQAPLNRHIQAGVGYEFLDFGKSKLGRAQGQTLNSGLVLNHLYAQGVLVNLTYLA